MHTEDQINELLLQLQQQTGDAHTLHYRLGNAYYKKGEWKEAIQHYMEACELNSESPAREKLKMAYGILEFYNKDIYGQQDD